MTMSYKERLSDLDREGSQSVTAQIADAFAAAIEAGELAPGAQLPPTRELAEIAGVNHLTAARAYRKLAELGLVSGRVGRGTFVRQAAPEATRALAGAETDSAWQLYALPDEVETHSDRIVGEMFHDAARKDHIPLMMGYPADELFPTERFARIVSDLVATEGARVHQYGDVEGAPELRERAGDAGPRAGLGRLRRGDRHDHRGRAGDEPGGEHSAAPGRHRCRRVADVPGLDQRHPRHRRLADAGAGRFRRPRCRRPRAVGAPAPDQAADPPAATAQPDRTRPLPRTARTAASARPS